MTEEFKGDLEKQLLAAVLGEIDRRKLEGRFQVQCNGESHLELWIADGKVAAANGDVKKAVALTAALPTGRFELTPGDGPAAPPTIPLAGLVLASARAVPEVDRIRAALGSLQAPLALTRRGAAANVPLEAHEGFLLSRVDGSTSIEEICQLSPVGEDDTLRSVYGLAAAGLIRLLPRKASPAKDPMARLDGFLRETEAATVQGARTSAEPTESPERRQLKNRMKEAETQNHYHLLGVDENASTDEIRRTYFLLAHKFHPECCIKGLIVHLDPPFVLIHLVPC